MTTDFGLAKAYAGIRTLRLADGPDEVHQRTIARMEYSKYGDLMYKQRPRRKRPCTFRASAKGPAKTQSGAASYAAPLQLHP